MIIRDQNGNRLTRDVRLETLKDGSEAWGVNVWWGGLYGFATDVRRYYYETRAQARRGDISDSPGQNGCVC